MSFEFIFPSSFHSKSPSNECPFEFNRKYEKVWSRNRNRTETRNFSPFLRFTFKARAHTLRSNTCQVHLHINSSKLERFTSKQKKWHTIKPSSLEESSMESLFAYTHMGWSFWLQRFRSFQLLWNVVFNLLHFFSIVFSHFFKIIL